MHAELATYVEDALASRKAQLDSAMEQLANGDADEGSQLRAHQLTGAIFELTHIQKKFCSQKKEKPARR